MLNCIPRIVDACLGGQVGDCDGGSILGSDFLSVQSVGVGWSGWLSVSGGLAFTELDENLSTVARDDQS